MRSHLPNLERILEQSIGPLGRKGLREFYDVSRECVGVRVDASFKGMVSPKKSAQKSAHEYQRPTKIKLVRLTANRVLPTLLLTMACMVNSIFWRSTLLAALVRIWREVPCLCQKCETSLLCSQILRQLLSLLMKSQYARLSFWSSVALHWAKFVLVIRSDQGAANLM